MRQKTKGLISGLILKEIEECHNTRIKIREIIREELKDIEDFLGIKYSVDFYDPLFGFVSLADKAREIIGEPELVKYVRDKFYHLQELSDENKKIKDLLRQELKINPDDYEYVTETKLKKINKAYSKTATEAAKE